MPAQGPQPSHGPVAVIGAGVGGLAAALALRQQGFEVQLFEASDRVGGIAAPMTLDESPFDAGPYVILDRASLDDVFNRLGLELETSAGPLTRLKSVYSVHFADDEAPLHIHADKERTAAELNLRWPGSGQAYLRFIKESYAIYQKLRPLLFISRPGMRDIWRAGLMREISFLLAPALRILQQSELPAPVIRALGVWAQLGGQRLHAAPSPVVLIPAIFHELGAWVPQRGMSAITETLHQAACDRGVQIHTNTPIKCIVTQKKRVRELLTKEGLRIPVQAVVSNVGALATYLSLIESPALNKHRRIWESLPLQSPGIAVYLKVRGASASQYLKFWSPNNDDWSTLRIDPEALRGEPVDASHWRPMRLLGHMDYGEAELLGEQGQDEYVEHLIDTAWWREGLDEVRVLATRTPHDWGRALSMYANAVSPALTGQFMRSGRFHHRSPYIRGLYLTGSSTHPGQWVSYCAISGLLAAECLTTDHRKKR